MRSSPSRRRTSIPGRPSARREHERHRSPPDRRRRAQRRRERTRSAGPAPRRSRAAGAEDRQQARSLFPSGGAAIPEARPQHRTRPPPEAGADVHRSATCQAGNLAPPRQVVPAGRHDRPRRMRHREPPPAAPAARSRLPRQSPARARPRAGATRSPSQAKSRARHRYFRRSSLRTSCSFGFDPDVITGPAPGQDLDLQGGFACSIARTRPDPRRRDRRGPCGRARSRLCAAQR